MWPRQPDHALAIFYLWEPLITPLPCFVLNIIDLASGSLQIIKIGLILAKIGKKRYIAVSMATKKIQTLNFFLKWNMWFVSSIPTFWYITCTKTFDIYTTNLYFVWKKHDLYGGSTVSFSGSGPFQPIPPSFARYCYHTQHTKCTKCLQNHLQPLLHTFMEKNHSVPTFHSGQNWEHSKFLILGVP